MLTNSALLEGELEEKHSEVPGANSQGGQDAIPGPALTAGFASTSDSYKAGVGSEAAKQIEGGGELGAMGKGHSASWLLSCSNLLPIRARWRSLH